jgi:chemotaxis protein MotB
MALPGSRRDRWLLPYADFITLLFAVFVMMYAMEKARDKQRIVQVQQQPAAVVPPSAVSVPLPSPPPSPPPSEDRSLLGDLRTNLDVESQEGFLSLSADLRGVVIALNDRTLFKPGEARIRASAERSFDTIASVLSRYPNRILLEGHTDSVPIHNARFRSNWELSTARSMAVMELLERIANMPASRFSIGGAADNSPVTADSTEPGRARNRRVEIVVLEDPPKRHVALESTEPVTASPETLTPPSP